VHSSHVYGVPCNYCRNGTQDAAGSGDPRFQDWGWAGFSGSGLAQTLVDLAEDPTEPTLALLTLTQPDLPLQSRGDSKHGRAWLGTVAPLATASGGDRGPTRVSA